VGGAQIYVGDVTGSKPVRLTDPRLISIRPAWSPDGLRIAFLVIDHGIVTLSVMNAEGGGQRALATVDSDLSALPVFSWRPQ
jgi:Tol biopolymer transport system component